MSWADDVDRVLAPMFVRGRAAPTREEIRDAYPFGRREGWPYKVWCKRVKWWLYAHSLGLSMDPHGRYRKTREAGQEQLL